MGSDPVSDPPSMEARVEGERRSRYGKALTHRRLSARATRRNPLLASTDEDPTGCDQDETVREQEHRGDSGYLLSLIGRSVTLALESARLCRELTLFRPF